MFKTRNVDMLKNIKHKINQDTYNSLKLINYYVILWIIILLIIIMNYI